VSYYFLAPSSTSLPSGEVQNVTLSFRDGNYFPQTITIRVDVPVALYLDSSVKGCYRSFAVPALHVTGFARTPADPILFTPSSPGTYEFRCSMGMGTGTLVVTK
jgi:plastocyanin domain-containing protein